MHPDTAPRRRRADARRNVDALIEAAKTVFAASGVDAPAKEITDLAGVGVGTLYRHFPQRSDLVKAIVESGINAVADAGQALSAAHKRPKHSPSGSTGSPSCSRPNADSPRRCTGGPGIRGAARLLPAATWPHPRRAARRRGGRRHGSRRHQRRGSPARPHPAVPARPRARARTQPAHRCRPHRRPALRSHAAASRAFRVLTPGQRAVGRAATG